MMKAHYTVKLNVKYITNDNLNKIKKYVDNHVKAYGQQLELSEVRVFKSDDIEYCYIRFEYPSHVRGAFSFRLPQILKTVTVGEFQVIELPEVHNYGTDPSTVITSLDEGQLTLSYDLNKGSLKTITELEDTMLFLDTHVTKETNYLKLTDVFIVGESTTVRRVYRWLSFVLKSEGYKGFTESTWLGIKERVSTKFKNPRHFRVIGIANGRPIDLLTLEYLTISPNAELDLEGSLTLGLEPVVVEYCLLAFTNHSEFTLKSIGLLTGTLDTKANNRIFWR